MKFHEFVCFLVHLLTLFLLLRLDIPNERVIVNKVERMEKELVVAYCNVLSSISLKGDRNSSG